MVLVELGLLGRQRGGGAALARTGEAFDLSADQGSPRGTAWALAGMADAVLRRRPDPRELLGRGRRRVAAIGTPDVRSRTGTEVAPHHGRGAGVRTGLRHRFADGAGLTPAGLPDLGRVHVHDDPGVEPVEVGELQVRGVEPGALEQVPAGADDRREVPEVELVDEAVLDKRLVQFAGAPLEDVGARLLLDLRDLLGHVVADDRGVPGGSVSVREATYLGIAFTRSANSFDWPDQASAMPS